VHGEDPTCGRETKRKKARSRENTQAGTDPGACVVEFTHGQLVGGVFDRWGKAYGVHSLALRARPLQGLTAFRVTHDM